MPPVVVQSHSWLCRDKSPLVIKKTPLTNTWLPSVSRTTINRGGLRKALNWNVSHVEWKRLQKKATLNMASPNERPLAQKFGILSIATKSPPTFNICYIQLLITMICCIKIKLKFFITAFIRTLIVLTCQNETLTFRWKSTGWEVVVQDEWWDVKLQFKSDVSINWKTSSKLEYIISRIWNKYILKKAQHHKNQLYYYIAMLAVRLIIRARSNLITHCCRVVVFNLSTILLICSRIWFSNYAVYFRWEFITTGWKECWNQFNPIMWSQKARNVTHIMDFFKEIKKDLIVSTLSITDHVSLWHIPPTNVTLLNVYTGM